MFKPFKRAYSLDELNMFRFLGRCKVFESLSNSELHLFSRHTYVRDYKQNEAVFFRKDPSQALYIIQSGTVELNLDINNRVEVLKQLTRNDAFGVHCILPDTKRIYNAVVTSEAAKLVAIPQYNINDILNTHPEVKAKVMYSLSKSYHTYISSLFRSYLKSVGFFEIGEIDPNF